MRKGISPIVASVLLLAVTMSTVVVFSSWAPDLAENVTEKTGNQTLNTLNCDKASVDTVSAYYNSSSTDLTITARNTGGVPLKNIVIAAFDSNNVIIQQGEGLSLSNGEVNDTKLDSLSSKPSYVKTFSTTCTSATDRLDDISQ
ncbi:MAG: hypothetical protein H8Z69_05655 [Nanohaloarchaea archaeon]|nr:hypothetical protein [Candidatus Nanohaloarchaea archaeon]